MGRRSATHERTDDEPLQAIEPRDHPNGLFENAIVETGSPPTQTQRSGAMRPVESGPGRVAEGSEHVLLRVTEADQAVRSCAIVDPRVASRRRLVAPLRLGRSDREREAGGSHRTAKSPTAEPTPVASSTSQRRSISMRNSRASTRARARATPSPRVRNRMLAI